MSTPFGMIVYSPPNQRRAVHSAACETAMRADSWLNSRRAPSSVAVWFGNALVAYAWKVPTTGAPRKVLASQEIRGAGGSCTWTTSKFPARSSRRIRTRPSGNPTRFDTDPLELNPIVRPSGTR
jgi:hypothetical protein